MRTALNSLSAALSAAVFSVAATVTAIWPDWIEAVGGKDLDQGDGALEWVFVAAFGLLAVGCAAASAAAFARRRRTARLVGSTALEAGSR